TADAIGRGSPHVALAPMQERSHPKALLWARRARVDELPMPRRRRWPDRPPSRPPPRAPATRSETAVCDSANGAAYDDIARRRPSNAPLGQTVWSARRLDVHAGSVVAGVIDGGSGEARSLRVPPGYDATVAW